MGQIVSSAAKPKRCNANQLSQVPTPAAGEHILVSSDNSMNAAGQGNFDCYIVGDGTTAATALELMKVEDLTYESPLITEDYVVLYGLAMQWGGKISASSWPYRIYYYEAEEACSITLNFLMATNTQYNGRYGKVNDVQELAAGNTLSYISRFSENVQGSYTSELAAGEILWATYYNGDKCEFVLNKKDSTITQIADINKRVASLEVDDDFLKNTLFYTEAVTPLVSSANYRLEQNSIVSSNSGYTTYVYSVKEGELIHIKAKKIAPAVWQFQNYANTTTVPATAAGYLVGETHTLSTDGYFIVPAGAIALVVCFDADDDDNRIEKLSSNGEHWITILGDSSPTAAERTSVKVEPNKCYRLDILNFPTNEYRSNYSKFWVDLSGNNATRTIYDFKGNACIPNALYINTTSQDDTLKLAGRVEENEFAVFTLTEIVETSVFDFNQYNDSLVRLNDMLKTLKSGGTTPFTLLHFSDIHGDGTNMARITHYREVFRPLIDDIIHTGDIVASKVNATSFDFWGNVPNSAEVLNVIGNHDIWYTDGFTHDANYPYVTYFKPYIDNSDWGTIVQPANAEANNLCYYYKDYAAKNIRLIVLDYNEYAAADVAWFENALADAKTNGYHVIVAIHYQPVVREEFNTGFNIGKTIVTPASGGVASGFMNAVETFIQGGGNFVCWLSGHEHVDYCGVAGTNTRQVSICVDTAALRNDSNARYRAMDTRSQDAFNLISVNTNTKTIQVFRVGNDRDAMLRHIGVMCIDYANGTLLYTE